MSAPANPSAPSRTMISGRYELGDFINQGGMGAVYRGRDTQTGRIVAIKHLKHEVVNNDPSLVERFIREGEALRTLDHPNIVKLLGVDQIDTAHYLVMEYVGGGSLADLLAREGRLSIERVTRLGLELSDALARAHYLKIIHRDLKPANILLSEDGTPRLTDFGIARVGDSGMTSTGMIIGTFAYLPPEVINGEGVDARADIWAFGVLLFEMLTGRRPFEGDSPGAQMAAILTHPLPDLEKLRPNAPIALVDLVYRMLEKDRNHRLNSMRLVGAELEAILSGTASNTRTPRPSNTPSNQSDGLVTLLVTPTPTKSANTLPTQTTPFIGREDELETIRGLLDDPAIRLVTLVGPGGMGKTRLSIEAATHTNYPDGAHFVPLAPCNSPDQILNAIADTLKFQFIRGADTPIQQLSAFFAEKQALLVMDNYEHLLIGAPIAETLLSTAPGLKIMVTSRERLNLGAETVLRIEGMNFPDWETPENAAEYSAVKLFTQGARRADPAFVLQAGDLKFIARICRQVQGLPLGILLAASWVGMLSLQEIAAEIDKSIDFLETEQRDVPERQRSIRAVFDYSWNLMTVDEREAFKRLSIFRGGFTREAAQDVAGAGLRTLMGLVNKSLIRRSPAGRYEVHELLRQYAEARLSESATERDAAHAAHSAYFLRWLDCDDEKGKVSGPSYIRLLAEIGSELDNMLTAWNWAVEHHEYGIVGRSFHNLWMYCFARERYIDGVRAFTKAVDTFKTNETETVRAKHYGFALAAAAFFRSNAGDRSNVRRDFEQAEAIVRRYQQHQQPDGMLAYILISRGLLMSTSNELLDDSYQTIQGRIEEALALSRKYGDQWDVGVCYYLLSWCERYTGQMALADQHAEESLRIARQLNDVSLLCFAVMALGGNAWTKGDFLAARKHFTQLTTDLAYALPKDGVAHIKVNLALIMVMLGDYDGARKNVDEAHTFFRPIGDKSGLVRSESGYGWIAEALGQYETAKTHFQQAVSYARDMDNPAWIATEMQNQGRPAVRLGQFAEAERLYREALRLALGANSGLNVIISVTWLAYLIGKAGNMERAVEILAFTQSQVSVAEATRDIEAHLAEFSTELPTAAYEAALVRGRALTVEQVMGQIGTV